MSDRGIYDEIRVFVDGKQREVTRSGVDRYRGFYGDVLINAGSELKLFLGEEELDKSVRWNPYTRVATFNVKWSSIESAVKASMRAIADGKPAEIASVTLCEDGGIYANVPAERDSELTLFFKDTELKYSVDVIRGRDRDVVVLKANIFAAMSHTATEPSPRQDSDQMRIPEKCVVGAELKPGDPIWYYEYHTPRVSDRLKNSMRDPNTCIAGIVFKPGGKVYHYLCPIQHVGDGHLQVIANGKLETVMAVEYLDHSESDREYYKEAHGVEAPPPFDKGHVPHVSDQLKDRLGWARRLDSKLHDEEEDQKSETCVVYAELGGSYYCYECPVEYVDEKWLQASGRLVRAVEYMDHSETDWELIEAVIRSSDPPPYDRGSSPRVSELLEKRLDRAESAENKEENDMDDLVVYRNGIRVDARHNSISEGVIRTTINADLDDNLEIWFQDERLRPQIERKDGDRLVVRAGVGNQFDSTDDHDTHPPDTCIVAVTFKEDGKVYHYLCPIDLVGAPWLDVTTLSHKTKTVKAIEYLDLSETDKEYLREVDGVAEVPEYVDLHSPSISDSLAKRLRGEGKSEELGTQDETAVKELVLEDQGWSVAKAPRTQREPLTMNVTCTVEHIDTPLQRYAAAGKSSAKCALTGAAAGLALGAIDAATAVVLNRYGIAEDHPLVPWVTLAVIFALSTVADAEGAGRIQEVADAALKAQSADMTRALTTDILEPLFQAEAQIAALSASESPQEEFPLAARAKLGIA